MSLSTSITKDQLMTALGAFLRAIVPTGVQVVELQFNRVPLPVDPFVGVTAMLQSKLSTPRDANEPGTTNPGNLATVTSTEWRVQLDCCGVGSQDTALLISNSVFTEWASQQFKDSGVDMQPLYATEPKNGTFINSEEQFEERWILEFVAQFNPIIRTPQDFALELQAELVEVDSTYPPGA